jgi:uncharacterized membrane protein YciS (DUF1049 family)
MELVRNVGLLTQIRFHIRIILGAVIAIGILLEATIMHGLFLRSIGRMKRMRNSGRNLVGTAPHVRIASQKKHLFTHKSSFLALSLRKDVVIGVNTNRGRQTHQRMVGNSYLTSFSRIRTLDK